MIKKKSWKSSKLEICYFKVQMLAKFHYRTIINILIKGFLSKLVVNNLIITLFQNTINSFEGLPVYYVLL